MGEHSKVCVCCISEFIASRVHYSEVQLYIQYMYVHVCMCVFCTNCSVGIHHILLCAVSVFVSFLSHLSTSIANHLPRINVTS